MIRCCKKYNLLTKTWSYSEFVKDEENNIILVWSSNKKGDVK